MTMSYGKKLYSEVGATVNRQMLREEGSEVTRGEQERVFSRQRPIGPMAAFPHSARDSPAHDRKDNYRHDSIPSNDPVHCLLHDSARQPHDTPQLRAQAIS